MRKTVRALWAMLLAAVMTLTVVAMPLEGMLAGVFAAEPTEYIVLDDCDTRDYFSNFSLDSLYKMQGESSVSVSVNGTKELKNTKDYGAAVSKEMLDNWYVEFWMYLSTRSKLNVNASSLALLDSNTSKATAGLNQLTLSNKGDGWYKVQGKLSNFVYSGGKDNFTTLNQVALTLTSNNGTVEVRVDDITLIASLEADDTAALQEIVATAEAFDTTGGTDTNVAAFEKAKKQANARLTGVSQRDVDVAVTNLKNAMNAFGMQGLEVDKEAFVGYIDFNTKKYSRIDRYAIRNADGTAGQVTEEALAGKTAAAFSGELLLAINDEYISKNDATVRVTYTYYDDAEGSLALSYNGQNAAEQDGGSATLAGGGLWQRRTVKVTDAQFVEGIDGKYDLKIALDDADIAYITRVEVKLVTADDLTESEVPEFAPMTDVNNFEDKSVTGYQMWFTAGGPWVHWASGNLPSNDKISFEMWPDTSEYPDSELHDTGFKNLGDGRPAQLFTSVTEAVVDLHISWMQESGLDGFAIQRFYGSYNSGRESDYKNLVLAAAAAEKYDRVFYVMYDLNGAYSAGNQAAEVLKSDFVRNVEQTGVVSSTSYAQMDGRPVVCMWGLDPSSESYATHDATMEFICWLQDRGYYVIGGTANNTWYDGTNEFTDVYRQLDMISPWTVGRYSLNSAAEWMRNNVAPALEACEAYGMEYQPVVLAGSGWHNHNWGMPNDQPRMAGAFLWRQVYLLKTLYKCERIYFAMFDEYDEATAIMKAAQDSYDIPEDEQYFTTLSTDGTWLSSDFYLRMAGEICELMRGDEDAAMTHDIAHSHGPIYWRNSFEQRWTLVRQEDDTMANGRRTVGISLESLDVGLPFIANWDVRAGVALTSKKYECADYVEYVEGNNDHKAYGTNTTGSGLHCDPSKTRTTNGTWSMQFNGTSEGGSDGYATYRIAQTNITVSAAEMELSYDIYAANELGKAVYMDLVFDINGNERLLSEFADVKTTELRVGNWVKCSVTIPASLIGQKIVYVAVGFESRDAGEFNAYIDNVVLQNTGTKEEMLRSAILGATAMESESEALTAAIDAGKALVSDGGTDKEMLAAKKAIDAVIREEGITALKSASGDVNGDGAVNTTDARLVLQYAVGKIDASALDLSVADVNGDGTVNTTDARLILQFAVGKISSFA